MGRPKATEAECRTYTVTTVARRQQTGIVDVGIRGVRLGAGPPTDWITVRCGTWPDGEWPPKMGQRIQVVPARVLAVG
jgi:hypothetical protein